MSWFSWCAPRVALLIVGSVMGMSECRQIFVRTPFACPTFKLSHVALATLAVAPVGPGFFSLRFVT